MSRNEDRHDDRSSRRRSNIMEQSLRRARGEPIDEDPYDDEPPPPRVGGGEEYSGFADRSYRRPSRGGGGGGGGGCAQMVLYLVIGALLAMLIAGFFFNQAASGVTGVFSGFGERVREIMITPTPEIVTGAAVVQRIQQLSRLETTSYTIERVIEVRQDGPLSSFFGIDSDALLLIAHGTVVAGVDLAQLRESDVQVTPDGKQITLRLPAAQIFTTSLDNSRTRVYSRDRGLFAPDNKDLESLARQEAERNILTAACEGGIMEAATKNGEESLRQLLSLSGFEQITIQSTPAVTCAPAMAPTVAPISTTTP